VDVLNLELARELARRVVDGEVGDQASSGCPADEGDGAGAHCRFADRPGVEVALFEGSERQVLGVQPGQELCGGADVAGVSLVGGEGVAPPCGASSRIANLGCPALSGQSPNVIPTLRTADSGTRREPL
jgi:hypothetical protein